MDWRKVVASAVAGAVSGAVAGTGVGLLAKAATDAATSAACSVAYDLIDGCKDCGTIATNAMINGAVGGGFTLLGGAISKGVSKYLAKANKNVLNKADLGSKLDYQFGKAGGNKHNVDRTKGLKDAMDKLGFQDTLENRAYFEQYYNNVLNNPRTQVGLPETMSYIKDGITHYYSVTTRESFLMGKYGGAKVTSKWNGNKLITMIIKTGDETRYTHK